MERCASSPVRLSPWPHPRRTLHSRRDHGPFFPPRLDRLDARPGLRPDVSDALLRRMAGRRRPQNQFLKGSQLLGTLPAPLFLFLAGISFALVTDKLIANV